MEKRLAHRLSAAAGHAFAGLGAFGKFDLDEQFKRARKQNAEHDEIIQRFGALEAVFDPQPAEVALQPRTDEEKAAVPVDWGCLDRDQALNNPALLALIRKLPEPRTLDDVLHEHRYWNRLYWLRRAVDINRSDHAPEVYVRGNYLDALLTQIKPRNKAEAARAFQFMIEDESFNCQDTEWLLHVVEHLFLGG